VRILFVSIEYPPETPNGIGSYVVEISHALARRGHEVHVLSCMPDQAARDYRDGDVWVHRRDEGIRGIGRLVRGPKTAERVRHAIVCWREARRLGLRFDAIESPDWMAEGLIFALARKPLVAHLHTPLAVTSRYERQGRDTRAASFLERLMVQRARLVTSPSRLLADDLAHEGWRKKGEVRVIRYPINTARWQTDVPVESTQRVVLYAARLERRKAPDVLVEASARLARELDGVEVLLAGRSEVRPDGTLCSDLLRRRIAELGAPCRLLGEVARAEVVRLVSSSRVFALPSRYEGFGFAALEAMAAGRPVVCTSETGVAEILEGTVAGAIVPPDDPEALAAALAPYLSDASLAAEAGARARELVSMHCSPERIAEERERCYREVASRAGM
jgi:glycosyltransferase involved in cell wall biosynthesis